MRDKMAAAQGRSWPASDPAMRVCSVVSLDEREARAPLRRQLSVDEERGCGGHWGAAAAGGAPARGLRLYRMLLLDTLTAAQLRPPACALLPTKGDNAGWWEWWWECRALRHAAKRFSSTPQRAALRVRAASVQLAALDLPTFQHIMQTLFQEGGATLQRVLALFFFLADLSSHALRSGLRAHFCRLTHWAARHIADCSTPWVARHGGWGRVVRGGAGACREEAAALAAACAACALAAICLFRVIQRGTSRAALPPC